MPIYNGIEFIEESVNSIKCQTYQNWEIIIGVNGHSSNSEVYQIARKYENDKIKVYDLYNIKGKSEALNAMLQYCIFDWIALLDVDDKWLPKKLECQIPYMKNYDIIGTKCNYFGDLNGYPNIPIHDLSNYNFLEGNPIINSSVLLRKELCLWEPGNILEDYDLWLRLWKQQKLFYNVNETQVMHRIHRQSAFNMKGNYLSVSELIQRYR
tara:strand:+ start:60 stop:689 length:630 start_codon:yes stop_codon:yes gene_type:complete